MRYLRSRLRRLECTNRLVTHKQKGQHRDEGEKEDRDNKKRKPLTGTALLALEGARSGDVSGSTSGLEALKGGLLERLARADTGQVRPVKARVS